MTIQDGNMYPQQHHNANAAIRQRRSIWTRIGIAFMTVLVVVGAAATVLIHQISGVRDNLQQVLVLAPKLFTELEEGDREAARSVSHEMEELASAARAKTSGPLWKMASLVPNLGANFSAVSEVTVSAEDIAVRAVGPMLGSYDALDLGTLSPVGGQIDVAQLQEAAPNITTAANTVHLSYERMALIELSGLMPEIAGPIASATEQLRAVDGALTTAAAAARLLPPLIGADGPRNYLVLVQNSAESRATGGIPGALAILSADGGRISMGVQDSASALGAFRPAIDVDEEQEALYTARLGTQMQNVNLTPDFPTAAKTAKRMWEQRHSNQIVDGVLAIDPVVLSKLLDATGPVSLTDEQTLALVEDTALPTALTRDNVVPTLLSDVYREIENPEQQDVYFAAVAAQVFTAFTEGQGNGGKLLQAITSSAQEKRLLLWSDHQDEQEIIASTSVHGSVTGADSGGATFGVYFNDGTGAKMDYYVKRSVRLIQACPVGEYGQFTIRVTASNNAPADAASSLPAYVTGGGIFGVDPGRIRTNYVIYGPSQSFVETATVDGNPVPVSSGKHGQRPVGTVPLELGPGETSTIDMVFSSVVQNSEPRLHVTPGIQPGEDIILPFERESCG